MSTAGWRRAVAWIPRGGPLPPEVWTSRHRWVVGILALQGLALPLYAVSRGATARGALPSMLVPCAMALLACWTRLPDRAARRSPPAA